VLRNELNDHLQLIRICSLDDKDILEEVLPTGVLRYGELKLVGKTHKTGEIQPDLTTICNVIEKRKRPRSELLQHPFGADTQYGNRITESTVTLKTKGAIIELCSVQLYYTSMSAHQCNCTVSIRKGSEPPIVATFQGQVGTTSDWIIPIQVDNKDVQLSRNSSYSIKFTFACSYSHYGIYYRNNTYSVSGSDFSVDIPGHSCGYYILQINKINYRTFAKRVKSVQS